MSSWLCGCSGSSNAPNNSRSSKFSNPRIDKGKKVAISQDDTENIFGEVMRKDAENRLSKEEGDEYIKKGSPKVKQLVALSGFYTDKGRKELFEYAISEYTNDKAKEHPPYQTLFHLAQDLKISPEMRSQIKKLGNEELNGMIERREQKNKYT